jgi:hypothetical protein
MPCENGGPDPESRRQPADSTHVHPSAHDYLHTGAARARVRVRRIGWHCVAWVNFAQLTKYVTLAKAVHD